MIVWDFESTHVPWLGLLLMMQVAGRATLEGMSCLLVLLREPPWTGRHVPPKSTLAILTSEEGTGRHGVAKLGFLSIGFPVIFF